jgi:hypothetical protein
MAESGLNQPLSLQGARFFVVMLECETMTKKWWVGGVAIVLGAIVIRTIIVGTVNSLQ